MPAPCYCFVSGDGESVFHTADHPTPADLDAARLGLLTIIRLADLASFGRTGHWEPIPEGIIGRGDENQEFEHPIHAPSGDFTTPAVRP